MKMNIPDEYVPLMVVLQKFQPSKFEEQQTREQHGRGHGWPLTRAGDEAMHMLRKG